MDEYMTPERFREIWSHHDPCEYVKNNEPCVFRELLTALIVEMARAERAEWQRDWTAGNPHDPMRETWLPADWQREAWMKMLGRVPEDKLDQWERALLPPSSEKLFVNWPARIAALREAHAAGRKEGMEEAAQIIKREPFAWDVNLEPWRILEKIRDVFPYAIRRAIDK